MSPRSDARLERRSRKMMQRTAQHLLKDEALIFSRRMVRMKNDYKETFVLAGRIKAHFYTVSRSGASLNNIQIENGQEVAESLLRVMILEPMGNEGDRIVPVIRGMVGGRGGKELYELMESPLDPGKQGITYEAPIKMMDLPYRIEGEGAGMKLIIKEAKANGEGS